VDPVLDPLLFSFDLLGIVPLKVLMFFVTLNANS
jgi:hypothetical protein